MKIWLRLLGLFKPYIGWMLLGIFVSYITLMANIALMAISGWFITAMAIAGAAGVSMNYFSPGAMIRGLAIIRTVGRYAERLITHEATFRLLAALRLWFFKRLEPLVPNVLENYRSGDLLSRIRADIDSLDNFYLRVLIPISVAFLVFISVVSILALYDGNLALAVTGMLLLAGVVLPWWLLKLGKKPGAAQIQQSAELRAATVDGVQGMAELIVYGAIDKHSAHIAQINQTLGNNQKRMGQVSGISQAGMLLISNFTVIAVLLIAIPLLHAGKIAPAELAMLAMLSLAIFESVLPMAEGMRLFGQVKAAAERLFEIADQPVEIDEPEKPLAKPSEFIWQFEAVNFAYANDRTTVLDNISFSIKPGQKVALVGETGAGKSSIVQLLLKHRLPQQGEIKLAGHSLLNYASEDLHDWISVAPQQIHLFNTTLRDNLRLGNPQANQAEIEQVCRIAQLENYIAQQPDGLDTWVGETGIKVSGGEQKRIAIARALLADFELLILDEPTEGLDVITARTLLSDIINELGNRSLLMITHQYQSLALFDTIIVLEQGRLKFKYAS